MDKKIDLYLWIIPHSDVLYKLGGIDRETADHYAMLWFSADDNNDYMYVLEGSKPWSTPEPTIHDITIEWIENKIKNLEESQ